MSSELDLLAALLAGGMESSSPAAPAAPAAAAPGPGPAAAPVVATAPLAVQQLQHQQPATAAARLPGGSRGNEGVIAGVDVDRLRQWVQSTDVKDQVKTGLQNNIDQFKHTKDVNKLVQNISTKVGKMRFQAAIRHFPPGLVNPQHQQQHVTATIVSSSPASLPTSTPSSASATSGAAAAAAVAAAMANTNNKRPLPPPTQTDPSKRPRLDTAPMGGSLAAIAPQRQPMLAVPAAARPPPPSSSVTRPGMGGALGFLGSASALSPGQSVRPPTTGQPVAPAAINLDADDSPPGSPDANRPTTDVTKLMDVFKYADISTENEQMLTAMKEPAEPDLVGDAIQFNSEALEAIVKKQAKSAGVQKIQQEVLDLIVQATKERLRDIIEELVQISKHRVEARKLDQNTTVLSNPQRQIWLIDRIAQRKFDDEESQRAPPTQGDNQFKSQQANTSALTMVGLKQRSWANAAAPSQSAAGSSSSSAAADARGPAETEAEAQARIARTNAQRVVDKRRLTLADLIFYLEHEPQMRKTDILYKAYLRFGSAF